MTDTTDDPLTPERLTEMRGVYERYWGGAPSKHPTVKPVALMTWLVRLVTPPRGHVLDPFMGTGTTGIAAFAEGCEFTGIELDPEYIEIARQRLGLAAA